MATPGSAIAATASTMETDLVISLADLPTELLRQIACYLAPPDLASLARGCKSLCQATIHILYMDITTRSLSQLKSVGQKLAADPSLARGPRRIDARRFDTTPRASDARPFPILLEILKVKMPFLKTLVLEEGDIGCKESPEPPESQEIVEAILSQPSLEQFYYARYITRDDECGPMTQMMRVLHHPSVRVVTFKWTLPTSQAITEHAHDDAQPARPLHLRFWHCEIEPDQLRTIISQIKHLSAFSFHHNYFLNYNNYGTRLAEVKPLLDALKPAAQTLEALTIVYHPHWRLGEFVKLKYLRVGAEFVRSIGDSPQDSKRQMPPYLEHLALELINMNDWDFWPIVETIELKEIVFPHLKRLTIHAIHPREPERLMKAAADVGLSIDFARCFYERDWLEEDWSSKT